MFTSVILIQCDFWCSVWCSVFWCQKVYKAWTDVSERKTFWSYFVFILSFAIDFPLKIRNMIVTVYVVISQFQIKYFPILNLPSFQCFWSFMVNIGFLIAPVFKILFCYLVYNVASSFKRNKIRLGSVSFFLILHDDGNSIIYILKVVMSFQYSAFTCMK